MATITTTGYRITWYAVNGSERTPLTKRMRPNGYDATCSCGWETRTGGAIKSCIQREIRTHKLVDHDADFIFNR